MLVYFVLGVKQQVGMDIKGIHPRFQNHFQVAQFGCCYMREK